MDNEMFTIHDSEEYVKSYIQKELVWDEKECREEERRQKRFDESCKKAIISAKKKRRRQELKQIKRVYGPRKQEHSIDLSTTTKQLMMFVFINCTIIEVYSMIAMLIASDLSALSTLVTSVVAEAFAFAIYCTKSYFETRSQKENELELKKMELDNTNNTY